MLGYRFRFYLAEFSEILRFYLPTYIPATTKISYLKFLSKKYVIPKLTLSALPEKISLETRTKCNGQCPFCAASVKNETRKDTTMHDEIFKKIITELSVKYFNGLLTFSGNNEPLLDKNLIERIRFAKTMLTHAKFGLMTNGVLLTNEVGQKLFDAGLDRLYINNYSYDGIIRKNIYDFIKKTKPLYKDKDIQLFQSRYNNKMVTNRAGSNPQKLLQQFLPLPCKFLFEQFNITTSGRVCLCCQDIYCAGDLGNVTNNSIEGIWNNDKINSLRNNILQGNRNCSPLCSICDFIGFSPGDVPFPHNYLVRFKLM